jgi:SAM-dependent methyltransferase
MDDHREYLRENREHWEELAELHPDTEFYDVASFLEGETSLLPLEGEELGPLVQEGATLLHLQCHFGMDTLSWARGGARVVGVDFSGTAVETARELAVETARELAVETALDDRAEFVEADVYDLPDDLDGEFDVVFTSYGVLPWLPDLEGWAGVVEQYVAPDGTFYVAENHPFTLCLDEESGPGGFRFAYPYFGGEHVEFGVDGSYADPDATPEHTRTHEFSHSMGEILTALLGTDLELEFVREHPWSEFRQLTGMKADEEGRWWLPGLEHDLPFPFSVRARMPARGPTEPDGNTRRTRTASRASARHRIRGGGTATRFTRRVSEANGAQFFPTFFQGVVPAARRRRARTPDAGKSG